MSEVEIKDNTKKVLEGTDLAIERALEVIGGKMLTYAVDLCPVNTGLLSNSITYALDGQAPVKGSYTDNAGEQSGGYEGTMPKAEEKEVRYVAVGTNVEYAPYVELGAKGRKPRHFLKRAVSNHISEYREDLEIELKKVGK